MESQLDLTLHFDALIILVLRIPPTMIHQLSSQLLQLSSFYRILFSNSVKELYTSLMPKLSVALTSSYQVLEERRISEKYFMVMIQQIQQYSGTAICQQLTSNPGPLLPKPTL